MAKKHPVKYAYGSPAAYNNLAVKDEFTVYFIVDADDYGTLYKGVNCLGSVDCAKIYFTKDVTARLGDTSYTITKGTSVQDAFKDLYVDMLRQTATVQDDVLAYVDETYAKPSDIDTAIYDFREGYLKDHYYDKEESDARYVPASELENIRQLAAIFSDDEKMQQLIDAAEGIDAILSNYYDKEYIDSSVDNVLTFDSSADFPAEGKINKIYIDDDGNTMYRWATEFDGLPDRTYIPISGAGGGGGGGGSDVKVESAVYIKGMKTNDSVAAGTPYTLEFAYTSANTFTSYNKETGQFEKVVQQTGKTGAAKYFIDGMQFASGSVRQANFDELDDSKNVYNTFVIPAARFTGSQHVIKIQVTDIAGNVASEEITISLISVSIRSSYSPNPISLSKEITIPVTVASTNVSEVYYEIDGGESDEPKARIPAGGGSAVLTVYPYTPDGTPRSHGVHNIKIWATTYIPQSDTTLTTNILEYNTIWYDINENAPIIASSINAEQDETGAYKSTQYEFVNIAYQVYPSSTITLNVRDENAGTTTVVNTLNVDSTSKNWSYTFEEPGLYTLYIEAIYGINMKVRSEEYVVSVDEAAYSLKPAAGSNMFFTAKGRSNDEDPVTRETWRAEIGDYTATLEDFAWNSNSGWYQNENTTALRVAGGARCTIPFKPFATDGRQYGQVIEFDFSTTNISDSTTTVISCFSEQDNSGIVINANNAYFTSTEFSLSDSADTRIKVPFKENERVRISFVITPLNADDAGSNSHEVSIWNANEGRYVTKDSVAEGWWRFVKVYVNGICTAVNQYSAANTFKQQFPSSIVIGSDSATVDIYSIRSYPTALYDKALVDNFVADTQDPAERMRLYLRNNILKENGLDIDYSKLLLKMPCMFITCESDVTDLTYGYANAEHILPMNKKDKRGYTVIFNCDQLDDEAREYYDFCHSFTAYNAQMTVQGTSSQYYPRKNYKLKIKPQKKLMNGGDVNNIADYNKVLATKKPTLFFWDTLGSSQGQSGTGGTPEGKLNRMNDAATYADKYKAKYILKDFGISDHEYQNTASITSVPATEFCLKADFAEASSTHNTGLAKYADYILKNMGYPYLTPPQKAEYNKNEMNINKVATRTTVDGYPIALFWRRTYNDDYEFLGKYNFNMDKGAEDVFGFTGDIVEKVEYTNPMTGQPFSCFDEDYYDAATKEDRMKYESPVECWEFTNNSAEISKFNNVTDATFREPSEEYGMEWLGSFEGRHPDNDNYAADLAAGKDPVHWRKFMTWVSSTNREGFHDDAKTLKIPYAWNGTLEELRSGSSATEQFLTYNGTLDEMNADTHTEFDYTAGYILEPLHEVDPATHELGPDDSYLYFGYIARYNNETHLWYVDGKYDEEASAIDNNKWYYINEESDANFRNVYKYNGTTKDWELTANLVTDYSLAAPVTYNSEVFRYDNAEFRLAKFANELPKHMNVDMTTAYYVLTEFFACVDQRAKNMMFASWGYESTNSRPAHAFADEAAANAAGYKGVYKYEVAAVNAAANPYASPRLFGAPTILGAPAATVCINEVDPGNKKMEFYNPTSSAINLEGYVLKGVDEVPAARPDWVFPAGATIPAKGFYVITFKSTDAAQGPSYGLSGKKAWSFTLETPAGVVVDTLVNDVHISADTEITGSWGRETDGGENWVDFAAPSIGYTNESITHVCINEVCPNALSLDYPVQKGIELYNPTLSDVNLNGWTLKKGDVACGSFYYDTGELDKNGNPKLKQLNSVDDNVNNKSVTFDSNAVVPSGGYFVVVFNDGVTPNTMPGGLGPKAGFTLRLYDNNNNLVDEVDNSPKVAYAAAPATGTFIEGTDVATGNTVYIVDRDFLNLEGSSANHTEYRSYGRIFDGALSWKIFDTGTPGLDNTTDMSPKYDVTELVDIKKFTCNGNELSGLVFNSTKTGFIAVSDTGVIYDITLDGTVTTKPIENYNPNIRFLGVSPTTGKVWMQDTDKVFTDVTDNVPDLIPNTDLEAITVDGNGNVYIMSEYRALDIKTEEKYPIYTDNVTGEETFEPYTNGVANEPIMSKGQQKTKKKTLDTADVYAYIYKLVGNRLEIVTRLDVNESMEGFCYYKDNMFFVGKQVTGKIYLVDFTGATPETNISLNEFADLTQYIAEVADVAYDGENVWALDSEEKSISKVSISNDGTKGTFVEKFMLMISESNPEGLLVDKQANTFWVCCDDDITDPTAMVNNYKNLFKIGMDNSQYVPDDVDPGTQITDHVVLNEIAYRQIELYNPTSGSVNIGGLWLVKTPQDPGYNEGLLPEGDGRSDAWQIPAGTSIPSKGFVVFKCQDTTPGPDFGISFKAGKDFDLYLMRNIGAMATATGAQSIDQSLVVDHISNYENPVVDPNNAVSIGRVKDGYSTICLFNAPSIGETNNNSIPTPIEGDVAPDMGTIKTPLYWVPIDCEYIYYPIFYDNDTILSLNNTGYIRYEPNVESTDKIGTGYAYNGTESVLWLNFKDAFATRIASTYATMRASGGLDYATAMHYFNETQSDLWPEVLYNLDAKFKYVDPATVGYIDFSQRDNMGNAGVTVQEGGYLYECQGSRSEHRKWWLNNRFLYMDSRYNTGSTYHDAYATMRLYTPAAYNPIVEPNAEFTLTPYTDMYLRVRFGSVDAYVRAEKNKPYKVTPPPMRFNNTETIIYGAPYLLSFGPLADKYADSVAIGNATKITDLNLGYDSPYYNDNLTNLTVSATNTSLKNIDVRGCKNLSILNGLQQINSIESVKATDTAITNIDFSTTGANLRSVAYPASIATVKLVNMNYISNAGMSFVNYKNLRTLWIENCPKVNTWDIVQKILGTTGNVLTDVRLTGINWNIQTQSEFNTWKQLLAKTGLRVEGGNAYYDLPIPFLSGSVTLGPNIVVSNGYKDGIEELFRQNGANLTVFVTNTTGLNGIEIKGDEIIAPNKWYTYKIQYLPDDYVLPADKGVRWAIPTGNGIESRNMTADSVEIRYNGSTAGTTYYRLEAVSTKNGMLTASLSIRPTATLESIKIFDSTGHEIDYENGVELYEGEQAIFTVRLTPEDTADSDLNITVTNPQYLVPFGGGLPYEYSTNNRTLTIIGAEVSKREAVAIRVASVNLPSINKTIPIHVNNIVSRVIYLQDDTKSLHTRIPGYAIVNVDGDSNDYTVYSQANNPGVIVLPTNKYDPEHGCFGFKKLTVRVEATDKDIKYYNQPAAIVMDELPETVQSDDTYTVSFYEPVTAKITVTNSGNVVTDRKLMIESFQNNSIRSLVNPPYNKIIIEGGEGVDPATVNNPATIKLLANTSHEITITELDSAGNKVITGGRYSQFTGMITTGVGTEAFNYTIPISRDYLGDYLSYDATELRMTVKTGSSAQYTTLRLYYSCSGSVTIDWGDGTTSVPTVINGDESQIYHTYNTPNKEYDIKVVRDTNYINWLFTSSRNDTNPSQVCFGAGNSGEQFRSEPNADNVGLVAYQSIGNANITTPMKFAMRGRDYKQYSKLITVGNVYKACVEMTNADGLFAFTTLEQIPASLRLFDNCPNITSFRSTFESTNLTNLPANFFIACKRAVDYTATFRNCTILSNISSAENVPFFDLDEDVEMVSLKEMFSGCTALISEVPAFWKTFYGCSFCDIYVVSTNRQNTFLGCTNTSNYENIPPSWGGIDDATNDEYRDTSHVIPLRYVRLHSTGNSGGGLAYFELEDIYPDPSWRFIFKFIDLSSTAWWEYSPMFGSGYAPDPTDVNSIENGGFFYDFYYIGNVNEDGLIRRDSAGLWGGNIPYHNGTYRASMLESILPGGYGAGGTKVGGVVMKLDTTAREGWLQVEQDLAEPWYNRKNIATSWPENVEQRCNLPLRIMYAYGISCGDPTVRDLAVADPYDISTSQLYMAQKHMFLSMEVYKKAPAGNVLIHNFIPVYMYKDGYPTVAIQDTVTEKTYPATMGTNAFSSVTFYKK